MTKRDSARTVATRLQAFLAKQPASIGPVDARGKTILESAKGSLSIDVGVLRRLAGEGLIVRSGAMVRLGRVDPGDAAATSPGGDAKIVRETVRATVRAAGNAGSCEPEINLAESPLGQLMRRKDRNGRPFLSHREFEAGERLRSDYTRGKIMPRLGANWEAGVSSGRRGDRAGGVDLTDAALAARRRVDLALNSVGPELSGLLIDVCCFLKGLETVERERCWPVRSAKIVLKTSLGALARHYHPQAPSKTRGLHWGADDFRPTFDRI